jgi:hypothetical protein
VSHPRCRTGLRACSRRRRHIPVRGRTELRRAFAEAEALGTPLYRWQVRAALADAIRTLDGEDAADARLLEAAGIIREVLAALSPDHAATYAAAPQVASVLDAVS